MAAIKTLFTSSRKGIIRQKQIDTELLFQRLEPATFLILCSSLAAHNPLISACLDGEKHSKTLSVVILFVSRDADFYLF